MSASIAIDLSDPTPPFEQVRRQLAAVIQSGRLPAGQRLPPVRQLAKDLGLANGTVARAYGELEAAGLVHTRRGGGTTVADLATASEGATRSRLDGAASAYVEAVRALGLSEQDAQEALARAWG